VGRSAADSQENVREFHSDWTLVTSLLVTELIIQVNRGRFCFWRHQSVIFLFVYEIYCQPLNGFASNSHGRRVWFLAPASLKV